MEDPVSQAAKKKPAFAFWGERQRKDSTSTPSSGAPAPTTATTTTSAMPSTMTCSATSPSTLRRIDALEQRGTSTPPSMQRTTSSQQAGPSSGAGLSGVQRLIQQYQTGSTGAPVPSSVSLERTLSGRRLNASSSSPSPSPQSSRIASSSSPRPSMSTDAVPANGTSDSSRNRTSLKPTQSQLQSTQPSASGLAPSETPSTALSSSAKPMSPRSSQASTSDVSSSTGTASATVSVPALATATSTRPPASAASTSQHQESSMTTADMTAKEMDAEKARRRRRLLQEQLRKRNIKRRSAGGIGAGESPTLSSDEEEQATLGEADLRRVKHSATSDLPKESRSRPEHARTTSSSSRRARLISESSPNASIGHGNGNGNGSGSGSGAESDPYHDAQSRLVTPYKPVAEAAESKSNSRHATGRPPSFEDTRPWLEFSPLLPDGELLESPGKSAPAPSLALLHRNAPSDLSASASQSSAATDSNQAASARPSPSCSNSASLLANDSPVSPTALGFSAPPAYPSSSSYLSIHSPTLNQSPHSRAPRTTKLPPPRPTPQAPLPPPPSVASSTASSTSRHASVADSAAAAAPTRSVPTSSIRNAAPPPPLFDEADVFGGHALRSRSYSLEQEVNSTDQDYQRMPQLPGAGTSSAQTQALSPLTSPTHITHSDRASTLAVPMIRQRSNSLQRKDREALEAAARSAKATPAQQTPVAAVEAPSTSASRSTSSKGPTVGRPRGFTVGAVPGPSSTLRSGSGGGTVQSAVKSRPRSLLSNQIFPLDLAEPRYKSRSGRDDDDSARKTYSMDIDRRVSSLTNSTGSPRAGPGVSINRGLSATSNSEREGNGGSSGNGGGSGERLAPENTDRRPSVGGRSRSGSSASLLQQVNSQPKSHASFVIAVVGHAHSGKSTVIKKGLRQFGLSKPHVLSERMTSHSTVCVVDQEQRTIEVLEIDASVLLNGPSKRFAWPKFLPNIDAVILCYDASEIASFRGMSELLENFAVANLSTVMLACKSEVHPKAVDPYYASDMACIYNVGLAECTVQSEEGKKRMRDCFSYLVKEVAKSRSGRARRGPASTVPPMPSTAMASQRSQSPGAPSLQALPQSRTGSSTSQGSNALTSSDAVPGSGEQLPMPAVPIDPMRARGYSNASSALSRGTAAGGSEASIDDAFMVSAMERATQAMGNMDLASNLAVTQAQVRTAATSGSDTLFTPRKMSSATVGSAISDAPSFQSEEDGVLHDSLQRAQMGLQNARSSGGYVSIEELWDKLFHAAISRTDERFVTMFMVFFRGFATPMDLLQQMMARFETLTAADVADGLVHRFALIRLTNMLGDWVLDYPGDLSHPETHALLVKYHRQLLHHPDTVHTAAQIHAAVEATANAVDLDALWSKAVNSDQTRHKGGIAAAIAGASSQQQQQQQQQQVGEADSASSLPASHSSSSTSGLMPLSGNTSHDFDGSGHSIEDASESHDRTGSESSLPMRPEIDNGGRSRSASDLTTSSTEGAAVFYKDGKAASQAGVSTVSSHTQTSSTVTHSTGTATNNASSSAASSANLTDPFPTSIHTAPSTRSQDQKSVLRSISNTLMEVDDEIIATELTRLEWTYFTSIQPRDLLRHILVPHDKRDGPVSRSISHFNYISNWVCSMILAQGKTKHRARMLEKFMNIASILRHDNNYGSLNSVLGGLSKTAVHRLKHTRELLKGKSVNKAYQSLVRLMSNERSSAAYRLALENSDGPTIPYVGVHLQDILSISDGNPSKRGDGMIHWRKFSLMDEAVMAVARCQQYDRYIKPNPAIERLVVEVPVMDDEVLYERSLLVEPRQGGGGGTGVGGVAGSKIKDLKTFLSSQTYSASGFHA